VTLLTHMLNATWFKSRWNQCELSHANYSSTWVNSRWV